MHKLTLTLAAALLGNVALAGPLSIATYPAGPFRTHPMDEQRGVHSLLLHNIAFTNTSAQPVALDAVTIELLSKGVVVDTRMLGPAAIERAARTGKAIHASGAMTLYAFQFGGVLGTPAAALAPSARLDAGQAILLAQQTFAFNGARDEIRITASGASGGTAVRETLSIALSSAPSAIAYQFPLKGSGWWVGAGATPHTAHRWAVPEEYALDIMRFGDGAKTYRAHGRSSKDYYAYGAGVHSAAAGKVVGVVGSFGENEKLFRAPGEAQTPYLQRIMAAQDEQMAKGAAGSAGNYVIIEHAPTEYSLYAHLKPGSIKVAKGDVVGVGQLLGELGTSGMSTEPHLHFQVCDKPDPVMCAGIPVKFTNITLPYADLPRALQSGDFVNAP